MQAELGIKYMAVAWVCLWKRSVSMPREAPVFLNLHISIRLILLSKQLSFVTCAEKGCVTDCRWRSQAGFWLTEVFHLMSTVIKNFQANIYKPGDFYTKAKTSNFFWKMPKAGSKLLCGHGGWGWQQLPLHTHLPCLLPHAAHPLRN